MVHRIAVVGDDIVLKAVNDDPAACYVIGRYLLWRFDDPVGARPYLERVVGAGILDAVFDLAVIALFALHQDARLDLEARAKKLLDRAV